MHLAMFREPSVGGATLSKLYKGLDYVCDILEDEVRELPGVPVADWKIHGVTAIPSGCYEVEFQDSQRFGLNTLTLLDVPGYKYIRIHGGNTSADTEGCLLPGTRNSSATVANSRIALQKLKALCINTKEPIYLEIIPAQGVQA